MVMGGGEQLPELSAIEAFGDGVEGADEVSRKSACEYRISKTL